MKTPHKPYIVEEADGVYYSAIVLGTDEEGCDICAGAGEVERCYDGAIWREECFTCEGTGDYYDY